MVNICHFLCRKKELEMICPHCESSRVITRNWGKRLGCAVGSAAGAVVGSTSAISGRKFGAGIEGFGGPTGMAVGGVASAVLGGLLGAACGCAAGEEAGQVFDGRIFDIYACVACGHTFNQ
jgi:DNA-directed RNA polymerase subunit RPC12/RpoP